VDDPLETLIRAIERFVRVPTLELTATELRLRHGIDVLELGFATRATTFAATDEYDAQGSVTPIDWIRHHCHMSGHAAARAVAAAVTGGTIVALGGGARIPPYLSRLSAAATAF
jgi:hypothetical protein